MNTNRIQEIENRMKEIEAQVESSTPEEITTLSAECKKLAEELHNIRMEDPEYKKEYEERLRIEEARDNDEEFLERMHEQADEEWENLVAENKKFAKADELIESGDLWGAIKAMTGKAK